MTTQRAARKKNPLEETLWHTANKLRGSVESSEYKPSIVSKQRVANYGEVYTGKREVNAMLDLVKQETERIESKFLEPACGMGNFLVEILERKLEVVIKRYKKSQVDFERYGVVAISSIYGVEIIVDNVEATRGRLFEVFYDHYSTLFKSRIKEKCLSTVKFLLERNIVHGNALTLQTEGTPSEPIVFSDWSLVTGSMVKRRDYAFQELSPEYAASDDDLFAKAGQKNDLGKSVFIPKPRKEYPLTHIFKVSDAQ